MGTITELIITSGEGNGNPFLSTLPGESPWMEKPGRLTVHKIAKRVCT